MTSEAKNILRFSPFWGVKMKSPRKVVSDRSEKVASFFDQSEKSTSFFSDQSEKSIVHLNPRSSVARLVVLKLENTSKIPHRLYIFIGLYNLYVYIYIHTYTYICMYVYMCVCIYIAYIYTHTHTQTHRPTSKSHILNIVINIFIEFSELLYYRYCLNQLVTLTNT